MIVSKKEACINFFFYFYMLYFSESQSIMSSQFKKEKCIEWVKGVDAAFYIEGDRLRKLEDARTVQLNG